MRSPPLPRRRWLLGTIASVAVTMWSAAPWAVPGSEIARERVRKKLISLLHATERARQVGMVYLQPPPGQLVPPAALLEAVLADVGPAAGTEAIRRYVVARIRRELQEAQVISVDGWIMSPTEAQLCGLNAGGMTQ